MLSNTIFIILKRVFGALFLWLVFEVLAMGVPDMIHLPSAYASIIFFVLVYSSLHLFLIRNKLAKENFATAILTITVLKLLFCFVFLLCLSYVFPAMLKQAVIQFGGLYLLYTILDTISLFRLVKVKE